MEIGEIWAYRDGTDTRGGTLVRVEIVYLDHPRRPGCVHVRLLDGEDAGVQEWASRDQLPVTWAEVERVRRDDELLKAAIKNSEHAHGTVAIEAAKHVFNAVKATGLFRFRATKPGTGVLEVADPVKAAEWLGWDEAELGDGADGFRDRHGTYIAAWPMTMRIAARIAVRRPDDVLGTVLHRVAEVRDEHENATYGRHRTSRKLERWEAVARVLHEWCGKDATDRYDELEALRAEVERLGSVVESAIAALRRKGHHAIAATIARDLGVRVSSPPGTGR